jgi:hypothetical protein
MSDSWDIAGIQHEIFLRNFPNLRHDLVAPLSIGRMTLSLLKRKLGIEQIDNEIFAHHIGKIDQQIEVCIQAIRALQLWDSPSEEVRMPAEIIRQGIHLSSSRLSTRSITIDPVPNQLDRLEEVNYQAFLYCWLGMLCYFEDNLKQPSSLKLQVRDSKSFTIDSTRTNGSALSQPFPRLRQVTQEAVTQLANHYSILLSFDDTQVTFAWV